MTGVGDFTGDGTLDIAVRRSSDGVSYFRDLDVGIGWDMADVIDHDNDGFDDVLIRNTADGTIYAADMDAGAFTEWDALTGVMGTDWALV